MSSDKLPPVMISCSDDAKLHCGKCRHQVFNALI